MRPSSTSPTTPKVAATEDFFEVYRNDALVAAALEAQRMMAAITAGKMTDFLTARPELIR